jgi:hypothetical protein
MRNLLSRALLSYQSLKRGAVGIESSTGALLGRSLRDLIDRSLAEVRLAPAIRNPERVVVAQLIEDDGDRATLDAKGSWGYRIGARRRLSPHPVPLADQPLRRVREPRAYSARASTKESFGRPGATEALGGS